MITKNSSLILLICLMSNALLAQKSNPENRDSQIRTIQQIDSLISIKKIFERTILVSFGADAITAIKTQEGIVVIDAGISTGLTSKFRLKLEDFFQSNEFAYVINTHAHPDHYGGNSVFADAQIIIHENGLQEISAQKENPEKTKESLKSIVAQYEQRLKGCEPNTEEWREVFTQKIRYSFALNDAEEQTLIKQPEITFSDSLKIDMGDASFEMIFFGKCHSESDILIYVPELNQLFTGDLFSRYGRPSINDSLPPDKVRWKRAAAWIEKRMPDITTIISGHGELLSKEDLTDFITIMLEKSL